MPDGIHAAEQRVAIQKALVVSIGELATTIRMHYYRSVTLTLPDHNHHHSNHLLPILAVMYRPTDY